MTEASVSFAGNLTDDPEVRHTEGGIARAMFRVAVSGRREQEPSFFTVVVWRDQAEHAAQSLTRGSRVVIVGRLQHRTWTAEDGSARSTVEVVAEELGPSLCENPVAGPLWSAIRICPVTISKLPRMAMTESDRSHPVASPPVCCRTPNTSGVATVLAVRVPAHRLSGSAHAGSLDRPPSSRQKRMRSI
jgi:single-strand DNA-binding protein